MLALAIILGLVPQQVLSDATTADIWIEFIKTLGIAISATAAAFAAWLARDSRKATRRVEHKVEQRRHEVRHEDDPCGEHTVVIEEGNGNDGSNA